MNLKKQLLVLAAFCFAMMANAQTETTQGLKLPRLTTDDRNSISAGGSPFAAGQLIYNVDTDCLEFWNGTEWVEQCGPPVTPPPPNYPIDLSGNYSLKGRLCFDVKRSNDNINCMPLVSRIDHFASELSFTYTFINKESYSNLTFYIDKNDDNLLADVSTAGNVFTITFKKSINSLATGTDKTTAKKFNVVAAYKDQAGQNKLVALEVSVQDCSCGCAVKTTAGTWMTFLCYNLGADPAMTIEQQMAYVPSGDTDATVYGDLYQWGRGADGHELRTSDTTSTIATSSTPGHGDFIITSSSPNDWRTPVISDLWQPGTQVNNPCPDGWRVPSSTEWTRIFSSTVESYNNYYNTATANTWTWNSGGTAGAKISPDGGTTTTLFLPAGGQRYSVNGNFYYVGSRGCYWSRSATDPTVTYIAFFSSDMSIFMIDRTTGMSVRCVSED